MANQLCIVLDFGGQYNQLIARRVRECGVYCEIKRFDTPLEEIKALSPMGVIFTGGPNSVYDETSPHIAKEYFDLGIPTLGICYGCQLMAYTLGGTVESCTRSEYGKIEVSHSGGTLFSNVPEKSVVWMSHTDFVSKLPEGFRGNASSADCPVAAFECPERKLYAVQFHPEVTHSQFGKEILHNFLWRLGYGRFHRLNCKKAP